MRTGSPIAKDTGLRNLPLKNYDANRIWIAIVQLAADLLAWHTLLAQPGHQAACWEPKRLRLHRFTMPATLARTRRRVHLRIKNTAPWAALLTDAHTRRAVVPATPG